MVIFGLFLGLNAPNLNYTFLIPKRVFLVIDRVFWAIVRENRVCAVALLKNKKQNKKSHRAIYLAPRGVSTAHRIRINFGRAGDLPNVITHAIF